MQEYEEYYFKKHPRARNKPFKSPIHPSINVWAINRMTMRNMKSKWKEFGLWLVNKLGYENLHIEKFQITMKNYYGNRRRRDNDNQSPKFLLDPLVESGMLVDDDYKHLNPLIIMGDYDKENPRMEIIVDILE
ncbi:hypothetical protein [Clostridium botulinum]|uniref:Uncharacterized protein n=1 Tax=Clostridium botulinum TaxID=1491 RepID=A0A9Q1UX96_CLOBO|nr:hypothetical protein [Clostridium botulinum]AEB77310.1 hypothetical protein CbC4_4110 [Clostridium botulinum BKT015925]KEH96302.1 hypothetical protein Y848_13535 [Clostridium botulinum C/D str. Sp77]KEH96511.1 hypothetical protein Z953_p0090 [Clostridium botulinum D str. 16868]KLU74403.1 hypothetical protein CBC3_p0107 [Clostridium botulinum V891]KOA73864.1 hypothetical protein ADU78_11520 [Clostridium botulinum]